MDVAMVDLEVFVKEKKFDDGFSSRIPDDEFCGIAESEGSSRTCLCECYKKVSGEVKRQCLIVIILGQTCYLWPLCSNEDAGEEKL